MCGRFTLTVNPADLQDAFENVTFPQKFAPRYNIAPTQPVLAIPNDESSTADFFLWGLIPMWAKDPGIGNKLINARAETLAAKPAFKGVFILILMPATLALMTNASMVSLGALPFADFAIASLESLRNSSRSVTSAS